MDLGSTQPLVKMSTRNISWGQSWPVRGADVLATFMCRISWKSGSLNLLEPSGPHRACYGIPLPIYSRTIFSCLSNLSLITVSLRTWRFEICVRTWCLEILFGVVFTKFVVYFGEEMSGFRLCFGRYISPRKFKFILLEFKLVSQWM